MALLQSYDEASMITPYIRTLAKQIQLLGHKQVASQACKAGIPIETFLLALYLSGGR